ncbi:uncharacterized protein KIAA1143 homolog [Erpetoichthys calabaricus]|uniref:Zgc:77056 n=1 Tax=Erpetoichthys calabaricus TaxID=27687 RepID=A0A8C4SN80_ERPCA|nr:uncharacterized protein KIAA1143 homolog [Erpetoichthys calabaricus]
MSQKKNQVSWVKPAEPSFLRKFKNDVGYKEGPTVETKKQTISVPADDSGDSDREDEQPQVVVLKKGDLSAEEVMAIKQEIKKGSDQEDPIPAGGKIMFKKPEKRSSDTKFQGISASSVKKKKEEKESSHPRKESSQKSVKNSSLLSFGNDEEEEEEDND